MNDYAGQIWFEALSGLGQQVGGAIKERKARVDQLNSVEQQVKMLSGVGVGPDGNLTRAGSFPDPDNPGKKITVKPVIDDKVIAGFLSENTNQKMKDMGGMEALMQFGMGISSEAAKARAREDAMDRRFQQLSQITTDPVTGRPMRRGSHGEPIPIPETAGEREQAKLNARERARKRQFENVFRDPDSVEKGTLDAQGKFIPLSATKAGMKGKKFRTFQQRPKKGATHVQVTDKSGRQTVMPITTWEKNKARRRQGEENVVDAPRDPSQRKANNKYKTPKGVLLWTGHGWKAPDQDSEADDDDEDESDD